MSRELIKVEREIARLEEITKSKPHDRQSAGGDLKTVQKLSELYRKRNKLKNDTQ